MRVYVLSFDDYSEAFRALRKLRKRGVRLVQAIYIVEVDHHNKVKDFLSLQNSVQKQSLGIIVLLR